MNPTQQPVLSPREVVRIFKSHAKLLVIPAIVLGLLAAVYATMRPSTWEASQALTVRNEVANSQDVLGRFNHTDEMKTLQETFLEVIKSRGVLTAALKDVGPPADYKKDRSTWPSALDVAELREQIQLVPPKGAEFGKTEVFYLKVRSQDRDRAIALAAVIVDELKHQFQQLLDDRAAGIISELEEAVALAEADLTESTQSLSELERAVGVDLPELRILHNSPADGSGLRREIVDVENQLRDAETDRRAKAELLTLLEEAVNDPGRIEALPSRLLESHATIEQLSQGLSTAKLNTSNLLGKMSDAHPLVRAAKIEQDEVLKNLQGELANAIPIAQVELRLADARVESLQHELTDIRGRFDRLAALRAEYANLVDKNENHAALLDTARRSLSDARASQAAAQTASLIGQIGTPDTGPDPVGLGRAATVLVGLVGGLLVGLGLLFLTVELPQPISASQQYAREPIQNSTTGRANHQWSDEWNDGWNDQWNDSQGQPAANLSLKRALQKIVCGNTA
jgi:succinoglycan biosynthesis transport protein ExoP